MSIPKRSTQELNFPLVSIVIPVLDGENYLKQAIVSALDQDYSFFEVIIGINPSNDSTYEIAKEFEAIDRIKIVQFETHVSMPENFNRSAAVAKGKYVKFLCHDDILPPNSLRSLVETIQNLPGASFVVGYESFINSPRRVRGWQSFGSRDVVRGKTIIRRILKHNNWIGGPSIALFELSAFLERPFDTSLECSFDLEYWVYLASLGKVGISRNVVLNSRVHLGQGTNKCLDGGFQKDSKVILERIKRLKSAGLLNRIFAILH